MRPRCAKPPHLTEDRSDFGGGLMTLRINKQQGAEPGPVDTSPVAWFVEMVNALDRGDLPRAVEAQGELERDGFRVTYRRRTPRRQGCGR